LVFHFLKGFEPDIAMRAVGYWLVNKDSKTLHLRYIYGGIKKVDYFVAKFQLILKFANSKLSAF